MKMPDKNPRVLVQQGWLQGEKKEVVTGDGHYYSFKGIPYAAAPIGNLRFKAPQPPAVWTGIRKATQHGPVCPQYNYLTLAVVPGSEDCLYLNVYTPKITPQKVLPVMVFIHGGGFKFGSGNDDNYGPDFLVKQDVVIVTFNYRLEVLGFLCLDTEDVPGNAGMKDQVAALKWIKENIQKFGGDPYNVTIFGESAGGASTSYHIISPLSKGLFNRAIAMSGVALTDWAMAYEGRTRAFTLGKQLGIETEDPQVLLEFLQNVPVEKLVNTNPSLHKFEEMCSKMVKMSYFAPVVEKQLGQKAFLPEHPEHLLVSGAGSEVDVMIGYTSEEGLLGISAYELLFMPLFHKHPELFAPFRIMMSNNTPEKIWELSHRIREYYFKEKPVDSKGLAEFVKYVSDSSTIYDLDRFMELLSKSTNAKRYFYRFCCVSDRNIYGMEGLKYGITGASHLDDMVYLFDPKEKKLKIDVTSNAYKMIELSCKVFTNFAKFG
ncbi:LOW QUALITY PROTEIN: esterase B1-like [Choristoneura fumiferana]|uniref:LOW QUALITY PROTEIN: esterase B1-like n=1 Tax=Choristoneura fumiferana TaxID=7141 RepID=UPI003D15C2F3